MKVDAADISNCACILLVEAMDGELTRIKPAPLTVTQAEIALHIKRCLAEGKKRITFEIVGGD